MAVDAVAFLGNLFAECMPKDSVLGKRRVELAVRALRYVRCVGAQRSRTRDAISRVAAFCGGLPCECCHCARLFAPLPGCLRMLGTLPHSDVITQLMFRN